MSLSRRVTGHAPMYNQSVARVLRYLIQLGRNGSRRRVVCCSHGGCSSFSVGQVHLRVPDTAEGKLGPLIGVMRALILARPGGRNLVSAASGGAPVTATCPPFVP